MSVGTRGPGTSYTAHGSVCYIAALRRGGLALIKLGVFLERGRGHRGTDKVNWEHMF